MSAPDLKGKIALVTGASRGIGAAVSEALAARGAHIVAVARTVGGLEALDDIIKAKGGTATLVPLDITDYDGIDRLGGALYERFGKLDILVGNAGMLGPLSPVGHVDPKQWDNVVAVNVTANWRLIRSMDPLLRAADAGRAIFVSSGAATNVRAYWGPYAVSKAALDALVRTYAEETKNTPIRVNLFNPGATRTKMRAQAMPGEDPQTLPSPEVIAAELLKLTDPKLEETGLIYEAREKRFLTFQRPA
ncbi:oxidoreductase [Terrihabitans soli]|uniref:Oxidoreductase n=1 Tax=Terrihabitans soli TaxID=708113 RepID=A0A6S6QWD7_9HYPH|nr:SDR family NAD(P)-dependent oxidoreductase [Terrihabitans soli]BCJ90828.1 oxidoreductase [Terrihabitans soli]